MNTLSELLKHWEQLKNNIQKNPSFRAVIKDEGEKCKELGVDPDRPLVTSLPENEIKQKKETNTQLISAAKPYMEHLSISLYDTPHLITLSDNEGWIIEVEENLMETKKSNFTVDVGINCLEKYIGNNGIGTALSKKKPVLIFGDEHYCTSLKDYVCIGVPIKDKNNNIIGALAITAPTECAHPGCLNLIQACGKSIESNLFSSQVKDNKQIEKLLATASLLSSTVHDIKNPLTTIRGLAQLGTMTTDAEKEQKYFQKIVSHVDELTKMLNEFLGIFKQEQYKLISPSIIIQEVIKEIEPLCNVQKIKLIFNDSSDAHSLIQKSLFKRAIYNILKNAVKAMPDGGEITINVNHDGKHILITIMDTGPGIPSELQDNIFEPFVQGYKDGTGLGLYMVYYVITKLHEGKIWFETEQGQGTTFYIKIPVHSN